jgi:hypothetical protein
MDARHIFSKRRPVPFDELRIPPVHLQQIPMTAATTHTAVFKHQDRVGSAHQRRVMRHQHQGTPTARRMQAARDPCFAARIEAGGGFVEQQDWRRRQQSTRQSHPLPLATRQEGATRPDFTVSSMRQLGEYHIQCRFAGGLLQLCECCFWASHADIPQHAAGKQPAALKT